MHCIVSEDLIGWQAYFNIDGVKEFRQKSQLSPFVNMDLRQNLAETKVSTLKPHLSLRPG